MFSRPHIRSSLARLSSNGSISRTAAYNFTSSLRHASHSRAFGASSITRQVAPVATKTSQSKYPIRKATTAASPASKTTTSSSSTKAASSSPSSTTTVKPSYPTTIPPTTPPKITPKAPYTSSQPILPPHDLTTGLQDPLPAAQPISSTNDPVDWSRSFHGLSTTAFTREAIDILMEPITPQDVEVKPDGIIYLPEIKYRRILNRAFGPGAWGLAPRGETIVTGKSVTREYGLVVQGRLVSIARGEQQYFDPEGIPTATEGCKSNALMRCSKDLGIASELWDPVFIRNFMANHAKDVWVEHMTTKRKKKIYMRKDVQNIPYPFVAAKAS